MQVISMTCLPCEIGGTSYADKFKLNIISPEKKFLEGDCEFLEFVSTEGELGIYAKHIPLRRFLNHA